MFVTAVTIAAAVRRQGLWRHNAVVLMTFLLVNLRCCCIEATSGQVTVTSSVHPGIWCVLQRCHVDTASSVAEFLLKDDERCSDCCLALNARSCDFHFCRWWNLQWSRRSELFFTECPLQLPRHRGALVGLALSNKAPSPPKFKHATLWVSGVFVNF